MINKQQFLDQLRSGLSGMPRNDIDERIAFYSEMIDDRVDEGISEEEAVAQIGPVDQVISQIIDEVPLSRLVKEKITPKKKPSVLFIILLILGAPLWLPVLIAVLSAFLAAYAAIWAVIAALWAADITFAFCSIFAVITGIVGLCGGKGIQGMLLLSSGLILSGLSVFMFFGCRLATKGVLILTKNAVKSIKALFFRKENAE